MNIRNSTSVNEFFLAGLGVDDDLKVIFFLTFLLLYLLTLVSNLSIMIITISDLILHTPMYFFLRNLAFQDICVATVVVPKMLIDFLSQERMISFYGCMLQIHFFHFMGGTEVVLFTVMSYDRYVAIANPLRYSTIMSYQVCLGLTLFSWVIGFCHGLVHSIMTARLPFCGPNVVKHFFCDVKPLLSLACTDVSLNLKLLLTVTGTLAISTLILIIFSYVFIGKFLLKIKTSQGRKRALSTCSGHFTVVTLQYGTAIFTYMRPSTENSLAQDRAATIMLFAITPALNPILYTLRNKDIKKACKKFLKISH
ncbi:olfactory receptor 12D1-like [Leptodactylus fuscus]|uniref:olfactory receptor 12D1-like n=1 Tax=Leptodactylus fuscus TaxID=238119 RepID=UPI003F4ED196